MPGFHKIWNSEGLRSAPKFTCEMYVPFEEFEFEFIGVFTSHTKIFQSYM